MTATDLTNRASLTRFAWLSIAAAVATMGLKAAAYLVTGSVGLLSDAMESVVNLVGALVALTMLTIAARPADEEHAYGHSKAEYFSSGVEGTLILIAAASIGFAAVRRLLAPQPIEQIGLGLAVSVGGLPGEPRRGARPAAGRKAPSVHHPGGQLAPSADRRLDLGRRPGRRRRGGLQRLAAAGPVVALIVAANIVWSGAGSSASRCSG